MLGFYELQLAGLATLCALWLFFDHRLGKGGAGKNETVSTNAQSRSQLMRQYLTVFAIVMGESITVIWGFLYSSASRCRLVTGTIRLLSVQRAIQLPRTTRRGAIRNWLRFCGRHCTSRRRMG